MKAVVYDIEIKKAIQGKGESRVEGIEYCEGWGDKANMGISVIGAYEYESGRYRVFCDDNKEEFFKACEEADVLVTFNGISFDDPVIRESWGRADFATGKDSYDIMAEMKKVSGIRFSLGETCEVNFGTAKSGSGALAPILWQQGKIGEVIDYCLNDVALTKQCFDKILKDGLLVHPKSPKSVICMRNTFVTVAED